MMAEKNEGNRKFRCFLSDSGDDFKAQWAVQILPSAKCRLLSSADLLSRLSGFTHEQRSGVRKYKHWLSLHVALALLGCFCLPLPLAQSLLKVIWSVLPAVVTSVGTDITVLGDSSVPGFGVPAVGRVCWMGLLWFVCVTLCFVKQSPAWGRMLLLHWGWGFKCCCASAAASE